MVRILTINRLIDLNTRIVHTTRIRRRRHRNLSTRNRRARISSARHSRTRLGRTRNRGTRSSGARNSHRRHRRTSHIDVTTLRCLHRHREVLRLTRLEINCIQLLQLSVNRLLELILGSTLSDLINNVHTLECHVASVRHRVGDFHVLARSNDRSISNIVRILTINRLNDRNLRIIRTTRIRRSGHRDLGTRNRRARISGARNRRGLIRRTRHSRTRTSGTRNSHRRHRRTSLVLVATSSSRHRDRELCDGTRRNVHSLKLCQLSIDSLLQCTLGFVILRLGDHVGDLDVTQQHRARVLHTVGDRHVLTRRNHRGVCSDIGVLIVDQLRNIETRRRRGHRITRDVVGFAFLIGVAIHTHHVDQALTKCRCTRRRDKTLFCLVGDDLLNTLRGHRARDRNLERLRLLGIELNTLAHQVTTSDLVSLDSFAVNLDLGNGDTTVGLRLIVNSSRRTLDITLIRHSDVVGPGKRIRIRILIPLKLHRRVICRFLLHCELSLRVLNRIALDVLFALAGAVAKHGDVDQACCRRRFVISSLALIFRRGQCFDHIAGHSASNRHLEDLLATRR